MTNRRIAPVSKPHNLHAAAGWNLPGTALAWILPLLAPWLMLLERNFDVSSRCYRTLSTGSGVTAVLLAIGLWTAHRTRREERSRRRRLTLLAYLTSTSMLAITTLCLAANSNLEPVWLAPGLTWLVCSFLIPLWRDDWEIVDQHEPKTGWKRLWGMRVVYCDPGNPALWVRMKTTLPSRDMGYTPNLGHIWGRLALIMLFGFLVAAILVSVAAL